MATWADFAAAAPDIAQIGERLLAEDPERLPLIATVTADEPPRVHPVNVSVVDGRLWVFLKTAKERDLRSDGRYALHAWLNPARPFEFVVRGRATRCEDEATWRAVAAAWSFKPGDHFGLYELDLSEALLGARESPDEWPPRYRTWSPT